MKRVSAIITAVLLCVGLLFSASAAEYGHLKWKCSAKSAKIGETVTVTVGIDSTEKFTSMGVEFEYDKTALKLLSGKWSVDSAVITDINVSGNISAMAFKASTDYSGVLMTLEFMVIDTAVTGEYSINLIPTVKNSVDIVNVAGTAVILNVEGLAPQSKPQPTESIVGQSSSEVSTVSSDVGNTSSSLTSSSLASSVFNSTVVTSSDLTSGNTASDSGTESNAVSSVTSIGTTSYEQDSDGWASNPIVSDNSQSTASTESGYVTTGEASIEEPPAKDGNGGAVLAVICVIAAVAVAIVVIVMVVNKKK